MYVEYDKKNDRIELTRDINGITQFIRISFYDLKLICKNQDKKSITIDNYTGDIVEWNK